MKHFLKHLICLSLMIAGAGTAAATDAASQPERPNINEALRSGDLQGAARQARALAESEDIDAQYNLSLFFWHGVAVPQNFEDAIRWTTLAAIRGHKKAAAARLQMGRTLEPAMMQKSMEWARARLSKAAETGDDDALLSLARSFSASFGFANDLESYFWNVLAVSAGKSEARRPRDALVQRLKQADILKTQQRASDWHKSFRGQKTNSGGLT